MASVKCWLGALVLVAMAGLAQAEAPRIELRAGVYRIDAEVVADQESRMQGLMHRRSLAPQQGMLFVFAQATIQCMWMRNTLLPLSVAFLDEQGHILNIEDMAPQTEDHHCAAAPARYALEMNKGWFAQKGIKPGTRLGGIDKAPAPR